MSPGPELLSLIDLLPEPIVLIRANGCLLTCNRAFAEALAISRESLLGASLSLWAPDGWDSTLEYLARCAQSSEPLPGVLTLQSSAGSRLEWSSGGAAWHGADVSSPPDVVLLRLSPKSQNSEFLAALAHGLRNPLAPIRNALQVMRVAEGDRVVTQAARSMIERQLQELVRLIDELSAAPAALPSFASPSEGRRSPPRTRILIADDNLDGAQSLAFMLELDGHDVRTAHDGVEAIEIAESFRPQVALLDIGMPRLDGYSAARELRGRPWGTALCLVALTGWGQAEDRRRAAEAGFDRHLVKPVDPDMLKAVIAQTAQP